MPTLKTFGASTFFSNFCRPLTWEQLEAREGTLGVSYSPDLLDLFFAFLSFHGTLPIPFFRATPDALGKVLLQGCYRPPGDLAGLFHITQEPHETPVNFYTRAFLLPLRFPCLATLGLTPPDIFAIESAVRQELLRVPLPQALDFLHSQILAILCVNAPRRPKGSQKIHSIDPCPPTACYLVFPDRASAGVPDPPQFRCWISRRVAPNMAVIGLKCNSTPWACSHVDGTSGNLFVGFTPGNFLQLAFPTDAERFPPQKGSEASHFAFALYITSTSGNKGRVGEELPTEQKDTGPTYVTSINGILLPFLLRSKLRPAHSSTTANSTLFQIGLPLFPREDSLAEALELPPLAMEHSFYMPVSAIRGLFSQLLTVPLYRQPNTLGWPFLDSPIEPGDQWTADTFLPLRNLLMLLPNFMPSAVQELLQKFQLNGTHFYNIAALSHLREKGILPGTRSDDMTSLYDWPLEWELRASLDDPFFSSLQSSDPENWQLLNKLGGHFLKRLIAALLAPNGHFPSLLLSTLWGIQGGFTVPLSSLSWSPLSFSCLRCLPLNPIFLWHWLQPLKPLVTSCAMLLKNPELPTPGSLLMVSLNSLQLMFFQLTARSSSKLTLLSCVLSLPTAQSFVISAVTIPKFVPFLRPVGLLSMTNLNRGVTPASLFSLLVSPAHASKFSPVTANKPVQGQVVTFCVNPYSSVWPTKELVSWMALLPSFRLRC